MRRTSFSWTAAGIVLLAVVTAVLAVAAMRSTGSSPSASPTPTGSAFASPNVTQKQHSKGADRRIPDVEPLLSMADASAAYRGRQGGCLGGAALERTTDGGMTWSPMTAPTQTVLTLKASSSAAVEAVAADATCQASLYTSSTAGRVWAGPSPAVGRWFREADNPKQIMTPSGTTPNPCGDGTDAVVEIDAVSDTTAFLLCLDGTVMTSTNGGARWQKTQTVDGAVALAWVSPEAGWVLVKDAGGCVGFQLQRSTDSGVTWQPGGCVGAGESATVLRARPALDYIDPQVGMAWIGTKTYVTADGGVTWQLA